MKRPTPDAPLITELAANDDDPRVIEPVFAQQIRNSWLLLDRPAAVSPNN